MKETYHDNSLEFTSIADRTKHTYQARERIKLRNRRKGISSSEAGADMMQR
jgi:hypothetical protein